MTDSGLNAYLALSELAGREKWCWRLTCTTCGCHHLREGLACLSLGLHPHDQDWPIRVRSTRVPPVLKGMDWRQLDVEAQGRVAAIAAAVDMDDLRSSVRFPDWLGHLGVVLDACREAEASDPVLSRSIVRQVSERRGPEVFKDRDPSDPAMRALSPLDLGKVERVWLCAP